MSITRQAELLGVNRSSLYYQPVEASAEMVKLRHRIDEIYTASPFYGYRRITAQLQREGLTVNHKAVARHMREMGLVGIAPGPNLSKRHPAHPVYPYLLRALTVAHPNHVWGIDITYIRLHSGWMYLVAVLDWYARYVVSWALDQTLCSWMPKFRSAWMAEGERLTTSLPSACGAPSNMKRSICVTTPLRVRRGLD